MPLIDFTHPLAYDNNVNYCGENWHDYGERKLLVLGRENRNKELELFILGFVEKYDIGRDDLGRIISLVEPIPSARRKEIELFLRYDCKLGVTENMIFLNDEVEPKGYSKGFRSVTGEVPSETR
ncbi:MAG: hypothetical protein AABX93_02805 [Nanoarchaeota archaeon]